MPKKKKWTQDEQLFDVASQEILPRAMGPKHQIWTDNKAHLIQRYLAYFLRVTKHGTYIDGFAGPQNPDKPDSWAARLVVSSQPEPQMPRIRHFHLFEIEPSKVDMLHKLKSSRADLDINVYAGDFNLEVDSVLKEAVIGPKEATFCLFDQRTFECTWATVERVAGFKGPHKIELFYFLANWWFDRAFSTKSPDKLVRWWGNDRWRDLENLKGYERAQLLANRFKTDLGYRFAQPFAIFERESGLRVVFYMVHASDHPRANALMTSAYNNTIPKRADFEQLALSVGVDPREVGLASE